MGLSFTEKAQFLITDKIEIIKSILATADQNSLVIFDVDDVLLCPQDIVLFHDENYSHTVNEIELRIGRERREEFFSLMLSQRTITHLDDTLVALTAQLQSRNIKILALTNSPTKELGIIPSMAEWRVEELKKLGYNFHQSWKGSSKQCSMNQASPATFYNGVIFTCGMNKGTALKAFLQMINFTPKKIIFLDDQQRNIDHVGQAVYSMSKTSYVGIHYTKAETLSPYKKLCLKTAKNQYDILISEKLWLCDKAARNRAPSTDV